MTNATIVSTLITKAASLINDSVQMKSSAELALEDAKSLESKMDYKYAASRALDSMLYSVGIYSPAYYESKKLAEMITDPGTLARVHCVD